MATGTKTAAGLAGIVPLSEHPDYKPEAEKLGRLSAEERNIRREIDAKRNELSDAEPRAVRERAASLLKDGDAADAVWRQKTALRAELADLYDREPVVSEAARLQRERVAMIAGRLSRELAPRLMPAYRAVQRRLLEAVTDLARANEMEAAFLEQIRDLGYAPPGMPLSAVTIIGTASEYGSVAARMVRDAVANGVLPVTDPLVKTVAAMTGREHFLPENAARIERERKEEDRRREQRQRDHEQANEPSRLWGGDRPDPTPAAEDGEAERKRVRQRAELTPEALLCKRVRESILPEVAEVFELIEPASVA